MTTVTESERKGRKLMLARVTEAHDYLEAALTDGEKKAEIFPVEAAHRAVRLMCHAIDPEDDLRMEAPDIELADLILDVLAELMEAYTTLAAEPIGDRDPSTEYERLLIAAEKLAVENRPDAARALAEIAGRWVANDFVTARKKKPDTALQHFGSPDSDTTKKGPGNGIVIDPYTLLDVDPQTRAGFMRVGALAAGSNVPLEAFEIVARAGSAGIITKKDLEDLRTLLNQPAEPKTEKSADL